MASDTKRTRKAFTKKDDETLCKLVAKHGDKNWQAIAAEFPERTPRQCKERWLTYLDPEVKNDPWTADESRLLTQKVAELGHRWRAIEPFFRGRKDANLKNHWRKLKRDGPSQTLHQDSKEGKIPEFDRLFSAVLAECEEESRKNGTSSLLGFEVLSF
jgi:hypothetical protein